MVRQTEQMPVFANRNITRPQLLVELYTRIPIQTMQVQARHSLLSCEFSHLLDDETSNTLVPINWLYVQVLQEKTASHPGRVGEIADGISDGFPRNVGQRSVR